MIHLVVHDAQAEAIAGVLVEANVPARISTATNRSQLQDLIGSADGLVTVGQDFDVDIVRAATNLKWVQGLISGTERLEAALRERPNVLLTSARGLHGPAVSEIALLLMLAVARKFLMYVRQHDAGFWGGPRTGQNSGTLLHGKTVGIAGVGIIGEAIAERCRAMGMRTMGFASAQRESALIDDFRLYSELRQSVGELDFLVSAAPLNAQTDGLFDEAIFAAMKPTAYFVNVGRGETVDEGSLVAALTEHRIAGAALDTVRNEPLRPDSPLWKTEGLIITPHVSGSYGTYMTDAARLVASNAHLFAEGRTNDMINLIDRASGPAS